MAKYEITSPDGKKYEVTAPDGASQEEILAYAKKQFAPSTLEQLGRETKRGLGLAARAAAKAVTGIPEMLADAVAAMIPMKPEFRAKWAPPQGQEVDKFLTRIGLPEPQDASERVAQNIASSMGGVGAAAKATAGMSPAMASLFGERLGTQVASAGLGSGAAGITREEGGGGAAQTMAALLAGMAPTAVGVTSRVIAPNMTRAGRQDTMGRLLNEAAGKQKADVLRELQNPKVFVPGEKQGAAMAASDAGSPAFAGLEKTVTTKYRPDLMAARESENAAARLASVQTVGKDAASLNAATAAREAAAHGDYATAFAQSIKGDPTLAVLAKNPYFKEAMPEAFRLAEAKGITPKGNLTQFLHLVKRSLDDMLSTNVAPQSMRPIGKEVRREVQQVKEQLINWMSKKNPDYEIARSKFQAASKPINQMQVGQFLEQKLTAPLTEAERPGMFAQAMRDAPGTLKRSVGGPRFESLDQILSQNQMAALKGVKSSLEREALTKEQANLGSKRAGAILGEMSPLEPPPFLHRAITAARFALEKIGVHTKNKTLEELAVAVQDPATAAKLMKEATPSEWAAMREVVKAASKPVWAGLFQVAPQIREQ